MTLRLFVLAAALAPVGVVAQAPAQQAPPTGDAVRGKSLYEKTYRCYACHGYTGQTGQAGTPRLVPMRRAQDAFITYLRKPATPAMPAYSEVAAQDLTDVYAYIRSMKDENPAAESIPILRDIIERATKR